MVTRRHCYRKIFFSIVARCLTDCILRSSYIDTSVQKGGIPKVSGCLELSQKAALRSNIPLKNKDGPTTIALQCEGVFIFTVQKTMPPIR